MLVSSSVLRLLLRFQGESAEYAVRHASKFFFFFFLPVQKSHKHKQ